MDTIKIDEYPVIKENTDAALLDMEDGVACLQFKTKANSLTQGVCDMINTSIEEVEKNYKGMIIGNQSKFFSAGANLKYIAELINEKEWHTIRTFIEGFQDTHLALKACKKPVVAAPYSLTFGGGAEVTFHSYRAVIDTKTNIGLVELGVGLIPAAGGVKEMLLRSMEKTNNLITDKTMQNIKESWNLIVQGKVAKDGQEAMNLGLFRKDDRIVSPGTCLISEAKKEVLKLVEDGFVPLENNAVCVLGNEGRSVLEKESEQMHLEGLISEYDKYIADKIAYVITGGDVYKGTILSEKQICDLELEVFMELCNQGKTFERIKHMLETGKKLSN